MHFFNQNSAFVLEILITQCIYKVYLILFTFGHVLEANSKKVTASVGHYVFLRKKGGFFLKPLFYRHNSNLACQRT